jgi:regulator of protease activity HflC (stomatin/prohibitin superfamily)
MSAIKDRMVAGQRQEQAQAEAAQTKTLADARFYADQKQAEAEAYQIAETAKAQREAMRDLLEVMADKGALAEKYVDYLIAQELKENSKWIISGDSMPIIDLSNPASGE